jgi:hypothetical protein
MRMLTRDQAAIWLLDSGLPDWSQPWAKGTNYRKVDIPQDSGRKTALARLVANIAYAMADEVLMEILDRGVWPSSENPQLFDTYRLCKVGDFDLDKYPCHLARSEDKDTVEGLVALSLYFSWGIGVASLNGWAAVVSHVGCLSYVARNSTIDQLVADELAEFGLVSTRGEK